MNDQRTSRLRMAALAVVVIGALAGSWYLGSRMSRQADRPAGVNADAKPGAGDIYPDIHGRIVRTLPQDGAIRVDHGEVKGLMGAMTMDLPLADVRELNGLESGQEILFDLVKLDGRYLVVHVRQVDQQGEAAKNEPATQPRSDLLGRGDLVPDLSLVDAQGKHFRLRELPERNKVITFFYARCPLEQFCPAQTRRLAQLQSRIGAGDHGVHLISLTLDAEHDNTDVLATYARGFKVDSSRWTLAGSDDPAAIRDFADRVGGRIRVDKKHSQIDHALVAVRVDGNRIVDYAYGLDAIEKMILGTGSTSAP
jgi:protein SCO1/2